jgi:hypothetical protein
MITNIISEANSADSFCSVHCCCGCHGKVGSGLLYLTCSPSGQNCIMRMGPRQGYVILPLVPVLKSVMSVDCVSANENKIPNKLKEIIVCREMSYKLHIVFLIDSNRKITSI